MTVITTRINTRRYSRRLATPAQVRYLQALRLRIGVALWNETKNELGITTPGTHGLSVREAALLIETILESLKDKEVASYESSSH